MCEKERKLRLSECDVLARAAKDRLLAKIITYLFSSEESRYFRSYQSLGPGAGYCN